jgi:hypothetical protein
VQDVVSAGITVTKQYLYALVPNEEALNSFKWSHNIKTWGKQTRYNDNTMIEIEINKAFPPNL